MIRCYPPVEKTLIVMTDTLLGPANLNHFLLHGCVMTIVGNHTALALHILIYVISRGMVGFRRAFF